MNKIILITTFFLLPFVTFTASAQFELPKLEIPTNSIITYEIDDDPGRNEAETTNAKENERKYVKVMGIIFLILTISFVVWLVAAFALAHL